MGRHTQVAVHASTAQRQRFSPLLLLSPSSHLDRIRAGISQSNFSSYDIFRDNIRNISQQMIDVFLFFCCIPDMDRIFNTVYVPDMDSICPFIHSMWRGLSTPDNYHMLLQLTLQNSTQMKLNKTSQKVCCLVSCHSDNIIFTYP